MSGVRVRVPATTANLGPGFDCLGCALTMYASFMRLWNPSGWRSPAARKRFAARTTCSCGRFAGRSAIGARADGDSRAHRHRRARLARARVQRDAAGRRGRGGQRAARKPARPRRHGRAVHRAGRSPGQRRPGGAGRHVRFADARRPPGDGADRRVAAVGFVALIPNYASETRAMRAALPEEVPFADAVFNVSHAAVLLRAFEPATLPRSPRRWTTGCTSPTAAAAARVRPGRARGARGGLRRVLPERLGLDLSGRRRADRRRKSPRESRRAGGIALRLARRGAGRRPRGRSSCSPAEPSTFGRPV